MLHSCYHRFLGPARAQVVHLGGFSGDVQFGLGGDDAVQRGLKFLHEDDGRPAVDWMARVVLLPPLPGRRVGAVLDGIGGAAGKKLFDFAPARTEKRLQRLFGVDF